MSSYHRICWIPWCIYPHLSMLSLALGTHMIATCASEETLQNKNEIGQQMPIFWISLINKELKQCSSIYIYIYTYIYVFMSKNRLSYDTSLNNIAPLNNIIMRLPNRSDNAVKTLSALVALCEGNPPVTGGPPSQKANNHRLLDDITDLGILVGHPGDDGINQGNLLRPVLCIYSRVPLH